MRPEHAFLAGVFFGVALLATLLVVTRQAPLQLIQAHQHDAIAHGAAQYVVDTSGAVEFQWLK